MSESTQSQNPLSSVRWLIALAAIVSIVFLVIQVIQLLTIDRKSRVGDGKNVSTYGFDLSNSLIPVDRILAAGMPKDGVPELNDPPVMTFEEVDALNREERGKYLVSTDRVIGVVANGQSRAYPLRVLNWHEIVNDTLGGKPIAVTYSPLCDSAVVYDRMLNGEPVAFGVSGLVYNSNPLIYNRKPGGGDESLWIQLSGRAVAGPCATTTLKVVPFSVVSWNVWTTEHPDTTVLKPDLRKKKLYGKQYGNYFGSDELRFPLDPLPPHGDYAKKTPTLIVESENDKKVFFLKEIAKRIDGDGLWETSINETPIQFTYYANPPAATVKSLNPHKTIQTRYAFNFAAYAFFLEIW